MRGLSFNSQKILRGLSFNSLNGWIVHSEHAHGWWDVHTTVTFEQRRFFVVCLVARFFIAGARSNVFWRYLHDVSNNSCGGVGNSSKPARPRPRSTPGGTHTGVRRVRRHLGFLIETTASRQAQRQALFQPAHNQTCALRWWWDRLRSWPATSLWLVAAPRTR